MFCLQNVFVCFDLHRKTNSINWLVVRNISEIAKNGY
jgi:hypothetical protein